MKKSFVDVLIRIAIEHPEDHDPADIICEHEYAFNAPNITDTNMVECVTAGECGDGNVLVRENGQTGRNLSILHQPAID